MTNGEKYRQIRKEAAYTGLALLVLIVFWLLAGFGLANVEVKVFHLPLWAVTSTIGVWFFAIILVRCLTKFVFKDIDLKDTEAMEAAQDNAYPQGKGLQAENLREEAQRNG